MKSIQKLVWTVLAVVLLAGCATVRYEPYPEQLYPCGLQYSPSGCGYWTPSGGPSYK